MGAGESRDRYERLPSALNYNNMTNTSISLYVDHANWLTDIGNGFNAPISDAALDLPKFAGKGSFREYTIEEGFKVAFGEMEPKKRFEIISEATNLKEGYSILFKYIERGSSFFKPIAGDHKEVQFGGVQFFSTNVNNHLIFPESSHCFIFKIYFSLEWMQDNMREFVHQSKAFRNVLFGKRRMMHFEPLTNRFVRLIKDVFSSEYDRKLINLIAKDKGYEAVVLFFDHYYRQFFSKDIQLSKYSIEDQKRLYGLIDFIKSNLDKDLNLDLLSREVGFSKSKLQSMFHYFFHKSTYNYIKNVRFERSIELLLGTDDDIRFIAHRLGYNSSTHFINIFKKHFGLSPKKYRMNYRKQIEKVGDNTDILLSDHIVSKMPSALN